MFVSLSNMRSTRARPASAMRRARFRSSSMRRTAKAKARGSRWGTSRPVSPSRITSAMPQTSVATTGMRWERASMITLGMPSRSPLLCTTLGTTSMSWLSMNSRSRSWGTKPGMSTQSVRRRRRRRAVSLRRQLPSPTSVRRTGTRSRRSRAMAVSSSGKPLVRAKRPTASRR